MTIALPWAVLAAAAVLEQMGNGKPEDTYPEGRWAVKLWTA